MELLFKTECDNLILYNSDKLIFKADNKFLDISGKEVLAEGIENHVDLEKERYYEKDENNQVSKRQSTYFLNIFQNYCNMNSLSVELF